MGLSNIQRARRADGSFPPLAGGDGSTDPAVTDPPTDPAGTPAPPAVDYEKRYLDTQAAYTQKAQEAAENAQYRQLVEALGSDDPAVQRQAAEALGLSYEEPDPDPAGATVDPALLKRLDAHDEYIAAQQAQQQQQQQLQADVEHMGKHLLTVQQQLGRDLTEDEQILLADAAVANRDENGLPQIEAVSKRYLAALEQATRPRSRPRAPHVMTGGKPGTQAPNMDDPDQRLQWQLEKLRDLNSAT